MVSLSVCLFVALPLFSLSRSLSPPSPPPRHLPHSPVIYVVVWVVLVLMLWGGVEWSWMDAIGGGWVQLADCGGP
jgi:hypothetical protein